MATRPPRQSQAVSRRHFLSTVSMAWIYAGIYHSIAPGMGYAYAAGAAEGPSTEARIREAESFLRTTYDFFASSGSISHEEAARGLAGRELPQKRYAQALRRLSRELEKYPDDAIAKLPIRNLRLVERLYVGGKRSSGCTDMRRDNSGTAIDVFISVDEQYRKWLFFPPFAGMPPDAQKIHHELYHVWRFVEPEKTVSDDEWSEINPFGKKAYVESIETAKSLRFRKGFACTYGMLGPREDRATVAELLMNDPAYADFVSRQDSVLEEKIKQVKTDYWAWTDGRIDEKYWELAALGPIRRKYWRKLEEKQQPKSQRIAAPA